MACWDDDNFEPDCSDLTDFDDDCLCFTVRRTWFETTIQIVTRLICGVFCRCTQWSRKCFYHAAMAVFCFFAAGPAIVAASFLGSVSESGDFPPQQCILFASHDGNRVEFSTDLLPCNFSLIGELVVACSVLSFAFWLWIKARCGIAWHAEMWCSLAQLVVLLLILLLAVACGTIITAGLWHTCSSTHLNSFATSDKISCDNLTYTPMTFYNYGDVTFFQPILIAVITAWVEAAVVFFLLVASIISIVIYQCKENEDRYVRTHYEP